MGFALDFTENQNLNELDQPSFVSQPGWYRAIVKDTSLDDDSGAQVMKYQITKGASTDAFNGAVVTDKIQDPTLSETDEKREWTTRRAKGLVKRLGLVGTAAIGQVVEPNFLDCIGKEFVLHLKERKYKDKDGNEKSAVNIDFLGVFPLDHGEIPEAVRVSLGLPHGAKKAGFGAAGTSPAKSGNGHASGGSYPKLPVSPAEVDVSGL